MPTTYFKRLNKAQAAWDHQRKDKQLKELDAALHLLQKYSQPGFVRFVTGRWATHHAAAVQQVLTDFENQSSESRTLSNLIAMLANEFESKNVKPTGSLATLVHTVVKNWKPEQNFDLAIVKAFGAAVDKDQLYKQLKRYSANGFVRFFRGELGNKHVKLVREVLKDFDKATGTAEQLLLSLEDKLQQAKVTPELNSPLYNLLHDQRELVIKPEVVIASSHESLTDISSQPVSSESSSTSDSEDLDQADALRSQQEQQREAELQPQQAQQQAAAQRTQQAQQRQAEQQRQQQEAARKAQARAEQQRQQQEAARQARVQAELKRQAERQRQAQANKPKPSSAAEMTREQREEQRIVEKQTALQSKLDELKALNEWVVATNPIAGCRDRNTLLRKIAKCINEGEEIAKAEAWRVRMRIKSNSLYLISPNTNAEFLIKEIKDLQQTHPQKCRELEASKQQCLARYNEFTEKCKILEHPAAALGITETHKTELTQKLQQLNQTIKDALEQPVATYWEEHRPYDDLTHKMDLYEISLNYPAEALERYQQQQAKLIQAHPQYMSQFENNAKRLHTFLCVMAATTTIAADTQQLLIAKFKATFEEYTETKAQAVSATSSAKIKALTQKLYDIYDRLKRNDTLGWYPARVEQKINGAGFEKVHQLNLDKLQRLLQAQQQRLATGATLVKSPIVIATQSEKDLDIVNGTLEEAQNIVATLLKTTELTQLQLDKLEPFNKIRNALQNLDILDRRLEKITHKISEAKANLKDKVTVLNQTAEFVEQHPAQLMDLDDYSKGVVILEIKATISSMINLIEGNEIDLLSDQVESLTADANQLLNDKVAPLKAAIKENETRAKELQSQLNDHLNAIKDFRLMQEINCKTYGIEHKTTQPEFDKQLTELEDNIRYLLTLDKRELYIQKEKVTTIDETIASIQKDFEAFADEADNLIKQLANLEKEHTNLALRTNAYMQLLELIPGVDSSVKGVILDTLQKRAALAASPNSRLAKIPVISYQLLTPFQFAKDFCTELSMAVQMYPEMAQHIACVEQSAKNILAKDCANETYHRLAGIQNGLVTAETATIVAINEYCKQQGHLLETAFGTKQPGDGPEMPDLNYNYNYVQWPNYQQIRDDAEARWAQYRDEQEERQRQAEEQRQRELVAMQQELTRNIVAAVKRGNRDWQRWTNDADLQRHAKAMVENAAKQGSGVLTTLTLVRRVAQQDILPKRFAEEQRQLQIEQARLAEEQRIAKEQARRNRSYAMNYC